MLNSKNISLIIVLTNFLFLFKTASSNVCTTPGCRKASSDVLSFIDPSINTCKEFYLFTCGGIFRKTYEEKPSSLEEIIKNEIDEQTTKMLIKLVEPSEPKTIQALKTFFTSCIDEAAIEKYGFSSIKRVLGLLGGWPVVEGSNWSEDSFSLDELLGKLRKLGYNFLQLLYVRTTVDKEGQSFLIDEPVVEAVKERIKESYHDFMVNIAILLGADNKTASLELQETLLFKMKLLRILSADHQFNKTTVKDVQEKYPFVNWISLFQNIINPEKTIFDRDEIYIPSTDYLHDLENLLQETSNRTLVNYIIWEALEPVIPYLPDEFTDIKREYMNSYSIGKHDRPKTRVEYCKNLASKVLQPTFEAYYIKEYFSLQKREAVQKIAESITEEFIKLLNSTDLYDNETREKMFKKAAAVSYIIGAPDEVFDEAILSQLEDVKENINTNDPLTMASILNRQSVNRAIKLGTRYDIYHSYYDETLSTMAYYSYPLNTVVLPAGIIQGLYFDENRPQYLNYGAIGTTIAYNLVSGFNDVLSEEVWTQTAKENYNKKTACLIRQAENFHIEDSKHRMNGNFVLKENICGLTGVEVAYRAYRSWVEKNGEEKQLPGLNYTPNQLFWISTATLFCQTLSLDELRRYLQESWIPHPTFRTFAALSNNEHFGNDFNCSVGSKMNPFRKCSVF